MSETAAFDEGVRPVTPNDVKTVPFDARFPNTNQTRACWQNYVDFYKCLKLKGSTYKPCKQFLQAYRALCPTEWVEEWNELRENGTFPCKELNDLYKE
eukprot:m.263544 g.263544  ORF g.263544 m.263544 type:complete len:98 (-) comp27014_c0_seq1:207-500(-)